MILYEFANIFPFFHILYSLILLLGLYQIGHLIFKIDHLKNVIEQISDIKFQKYLFL